MPCVTTTQIYPVWTDCVSLFDLVLTLILNCGFSLLSNLLCMNPHSFSTSCPFLFQQGVMDHICILGTDNTDVVGFQVNYGSVGLSGLCVGARWTSHRSTHDVTLSALVGIFTLFCPILHIAWISLTLNSNTHWVQLALSCKTIYIMVCWIGNILHRSLKCNNQDLSWTSSSLVSWYKTVYVCVRLRLWDITDIPDHWLTPLYTLTYLTEQSSSSLVLL